jgi:dynein heavy chain
MIQFSAQTDSKKFQNLLTSKLTKKGFNVLGAPKNKWILTFIDDLNMPVADRYGDQPPLELLRYITENSN